jgi:hypothetical protein
VVLCRTHRKERVSTSGRHQENDLKEAHGHRAMAISQASLSESGRRGGKESKRAEGVWRWGERALISRNGYEGREEERVSRLANLIRA